MITRIAPTKCLKCGKKIDAIGDLTDAAAAKPEAGDPVVCLGCGAVMACDERGGIRSFTPEEANAILTDPDAIRDIQRAVGAIHAVKVMVN